MCLAENDNALYECHITFEILKIRPRKILLKMEYIEYIGPIY